MTIIKILIIVGFANLIYDLIGFINKCLNRTKKEKDIEKMDVFNSSYVQALREMEDYATYITRKHDNQIVYKIDGDFNGDIKGDNVTVILMGDGNINGDIESKDGNVVLIKGDINGDIKANKIICPDKPSNEKKIAPCTIPIDLKCPSCNQIYTQELNTSVEKIDNNRYKVEIAAPYSKTKKEESEIFNYLSVHPVYIECPKCHHFFDEKLRVDTSVINNKVLHTMITPTSHESSYY